MRRTSHSYGAIAKVLGLARARGRRRPLAGAASPLTKPGDAVTLRAAMNVIVVVTACSMDDPPINGTCSGIRVEVVSGG